MNALKMALFLLLPTLLKTAESMEVINTLDDQFKLGNFVKLVEGKVLLKADRLMSRKLALSEGECRFLCMKESPPCLSVNVIQQSSSSYLCELFNWTTANISRVSESKKNSFHSTLQGVCFNNGFCLRWRSKKSGECLQCACGSGIEGEHCEGPFKDCAALQSASFTSSGVYQVKPDAKESIHVYCDMVSEGGGWTVISNRFDGSVNFRLNWAHYKKGFGDIENGEFWLGNDNIHRLTVARPRTQLYVPLVNMNGASFYAKYSTFVVADERNLYRLTVMGYYAGNAGDSMYNTRWYNLKANDMKFTTPDRDNDMCTCHCGGECCGWWFRKCGASLLTSYPIQWHSLTPYQMSKGSMKIKPYS